MTSRSSRLGYQLIPRSIRFLLSMTAVTLVATAGIGALEATEYHVSLQGSDDNDGSLSLPFRTVVKGCQVLSAGDSLTIHDGDYGHEYDIIVANSGTAESPITIVTETPGGVSLQGSRLPDEIDGGGRAFYLHGVSYITIDGLFLSDYDVALEIDGEIDGVEDYAHDISVKNSTFKNNGGDGISAWKIDRLLVSNCTFIGEVPPSGWPGPYPDAIQDYGVAIYHSTGTVVEDSYFYGAHNQALSFKQDDHSCVARRNIFEGALYTAIYLGQNRREDGRPKCVDLVAEWNIVRNTEGFRVKSPIRVDNCENAVIRFNYVEGFDEVNDTSGINVFSEALGTIEIHDNFAAFGIANDNSSAIYLDSELAAETVVSIHHNTIYDVVQDLYDGLGANDSFSHNISHLCGYYLPGDPENFQGDPSFARGDPIQQPLSTQPTTYDFDAHYRLLTDPFTLDTASPAQGFGCSFALFFDGFEGGDASRWQGL